MKEFFKYSEEYKYQNILILDKTNLADDLKALIVAVTEAVIATTAYIFLFRAYEKRLITELEDSPNSGSGFDGILV